MADEDNLLELATALTTAWLGNPHTRASIDDVPSFLFQMHQAVARLLEPVKETPAPARHYEPVVSVRKSLASPDHVISLITGKRYKTLRRHLALHGLTPDEYRARFGLAADYPMTAPSHSAARSAAAKELGLGRKAGTKVVRKKKPGKA